MSEDIPVQLEQLAKRYLKSEKNAWWVRDITSSYSWAKGGKFYWVIDTASDQSVVAVQDLDGQFKPLNQGEGASVIGTILVRDIGAEPALIFGTEELAKVIMKWHEDPRSQVATLRFLNKVRPIMEDWLQGTEKNPQVFESICREPNYMKYQSGDWRLAFNLLNRRGGVEEMIVDGKAIGQDLLTVTTKTIKRDGTFSYPDEL